MFWKDGDGWWKAAGRAWSVKRTYSVRDLFSFLVLALAPLLTLVFNISYFGLLGVPSVLSCIAPILETSGSILTG